MTRVIFGINRSIDLVLRIHIIMMMIFAQNNIHVETKNNTIFIKH